MDHGHPKHHDCCHFELPAADSGEPKPNTAYTCPMHPEVVQDRPGMCPECGMNLVPVKTETAAEENGHDKHAGHKTASFLSKFWLALILTIPIFLYSEMAAMFGLRAPAFPGSRYVLLALGSIVFFYGGAIFLTSAYRELKARLPGMMTLIAIAIVTAYSYSLYSILSGSEHDLLFELASLITIMLLGHWIEMKSVQGAQGALKELAKLLPDTALVLRDGEARSIPLSELKEGDQVLVKPGAKVPADGQVIEGRSELNEAIITGESKPVAKEAGAELIAGSINGDGTLTIEVTKIGEATFLAGVMRLVADAQASKSRLQLLSDKAAFYLTIIAVFAGASTFFAWLVAGAGTLTAVQRLVAVLVIACPHALGLAIPLVASISTTKAAQNGLLVRHRSALEAAREIDVVLFDKTGTLTKGEFGVSAIIPDAGTTENDVLKLAASINNHSEHPLAKAMVDAAQKQGLALSEVKNFTRLPGQGAAGWVDGRQIVIGNESVLAEKRITLPPEHAQKINSLAKQGHTVVYVISDDHYVGGLALADQIRPESKEAIKKIKVLSIKTAMITGDSEDVASWVAAELGLDQYFAKVMPGEKAAKVKQLQEQGFKVAMVGDGVNDAPALSQADLGLAIGAGTNVAIESAGIILVKNDPRDIPKIFNLSRFTYQKMLQNLFWATGYNVVAIPLAAGALAFKGIILQPAAAAILMSVSTIIVSFNAVLLRGRSL